MEFLLFLIPIALYVVSWLRSRRDCDLCGALSVCKKFRTVTKVNGRSERGDPFWLCRRCGSVAKTSDTPIAEMVAQALPHRRGVESTKNGFGGGLSFIGVLMLGIAAYGAYTLYTRPEKIRIPRQVPITVSVRSSLVGFGNVIQIANKSDRVLKDVVVILRNPGKNSEQSYRVGDIEAQEVRELGTIESGWVMEKGEMVYVVVGDALPIAFSAEQLGIE